MNHDPLQNAILAMHENRVDEAHRYLLQALKKEPYNIQIWLLLGRTAPTVESAKFYYKHIVEQHPDNPLSQDALRALNSRLNKDPNASGMSQSEVKQAIIKAIALLREENLAEEIPTNLSSDVEHPYIIRSEESAQRRHAERLGWRRIIPQKLRIPLAYLAGLTLAEALTIQSVPQIGLILHGLLLVGLFLHAALFARRGEQKFLITLTLAPLIRLMSLSVPLVNFPYIYWYAIIGLPLLLAALMVLRVTGYKADGIGLNFRSLPWQLLIGLTGLILGYVEYIILRPAPLVENLTWQRILLPALILLIFTGFLEEFIFRGLIQRGAIGTLGQYGLLYVSVLFAVLHLGYRSFLDVIFVFAVALFFGVVTIRTKSILGVTLSHGLTNITLYLIVPFLMNSPFNPIASIPLQANEATTISIDWSVKDTQFSKYDTICGGNDYNQMNSWWEKFDLEGQTASDRKYCRYGENEKILKSGPGEATWISFSGEITRLEFTDY